MVERLCFWALSPMQCVAQKLCFCSKRRHVKKKFLISKNVSDVIPGDFVLSPEYHGEPFSIQWQALLGYGYNSRGDVAIGGTMPAKRDLAIDATFINHKGQKVTTIDTVPTSCKINFN